MILFQGSVPSATAMEGFGRQLAAILRAGDLLVLTGPLGAGKTTMTRGLGQGLGVRGQVASPTFVLARTHPSLTPGGTPLVHVDAYRLGSAAELDDLDIDYASSIVVVEWGAGLLDGISESWLELRIERPTGAGDETGSDAAGDDIAGGDPVEADEPREIVLDGFGPRWADSAGLIALR